MISPRNILRHEYIGLDVSVVLATNPVCIGISGVIIDETKNMIRISTQNGSKAVQKVGTVFRVILPSGEAVNINGSSVIVAPERRVSLQKR